MDEISLAIDPNPCPLGPRSVTAWTGAPPPHDGRVPIRRRSSVEAAPETGDPSGDGLRTWFSQLKTVVYQWNGG